ncbi:uncharacterized protein Z518_02592 [Rhinocladiella mackenziei CBS 650.93]|uniref:Uncharacterized protein n=1 Tax=Rhinocladiella mackenziei CBS 650.93 TaxID=1442369 RepID=A0A0D2HBW5_9EURO|nr:uncharacterized protein Z518_02592 [Rhinocladiella mackenziei CBS 650.93]KIX07938.1 hypothetical protein Z518_02592 [Rhinocladiella mackenziei CBS 650.93]
MAALTVPPGGLVLRHGSSQDSREKHATEPTQVIRLDLVETLTKEILRSLKNNEQVRLRCGKRPVVQAGKKSFPLDSSLDTFPSEIFTKSTDDGGPMYFSGRSSHKLEVQKAEEDTAKSDEALAALESTLRSIQEQRASNETSFVREKEDMKQAGRKENKPSPLLGQGSALRKDHLLGGMARSTPSSPFLSASYSPRQGPTSTPLPSGLCTKDRIRLDAIRIPLVHLLAVRPMTPNAICRQLHASKDDCEKLLDKVARESKAGDGMRELKEKSYRELDVWKFPYQSREDRQKAIDHAIQAYDRMRVEKTDHLWQLLLPHEERGKGKILSRLNFDKPVPHHATPKPERPTEDGSESKAEMSDGEHGKAKPKKGPGAVQKNHKDKVASTRTPAKGEMGGLAKGKETSQSRNKSVKAQESKFKSSERIEDSDEEADAAEEAVAQPQEATLPSSSKANSSIKRKPEHDSYRPTKSTTATSSPPNTLHKSSLSSSSTSSNNGNEKPRTAVQNSTKSLKPHRRTESSASRISPRPRHDSSPQKPSPLGSSPPTTSTDPDHSTSSKTSNQSSAPSSPPSSTDMPQPKHGNKYSPVISDKSRNVSRGRSPAPSPMKRKAGPTEGERPPKRQQANSNHRAPLTNGTTEHMKRPPPARTDSERSSSPEKPGPNRQDVIEEAKRFQKYYKRYKDLYDKISQQDENERDDKDMSDLWKMHRRLKEMKADIWDNWDKVEKVEKVNKAGEMVAV